MRDLKTLHVGKSVEFMDNELTLNVVGGLTGQVSELSGDLCFYEIDLRKHIRRLRTHTLVTAAVFEAAGVWIALDSVSLAS